MLDIKIVVFVSIPIYLQHLYMYIYIYLYTIRFFIFWVDCNKKFEKKRVNQTKEFILRKRVISVFLLIFFNFIL